MRFVSLVLLSLSTILAQAPEHPKDKEKEIDKDKVVAVLDSDTDGSVTVGGQKIAYRAVAGTITVGSSDSYDAMLGLDGKLLPDSGLNPPDAAKPEEAPPTARMFYAAYFKKDAPAKTRPVTFSYKAS